MEDLLNPHNPVNWLILAVILGGVEIILPSTIAIGFALGAAAVALCLFVFGTAIGGVPALLVVWAVSSAVGWLVMRRVFRNRNGSKDPYDGDINEY